jgi:nucleotide-binding universal stress UspA family protein
LSYKDILVFLDDGRSNADRVRTAFEMAKSNGARLTGVSLESMKPDHLRVKDERAAARIAQQFAHQLVDDFKQAAETEKLDVDTIVIPGSLSTSSRKMAQYARNFDLVILRQPNPDRENYSRLQEFAEEVMLHCGRPIFFMPYIGSHRIPCQKVMVAWDGSPAAARAVHDSIPLLAQSREVTIASISSKKANEKDIMLDQLASHLQHHGITTDKKFIEPGTFDIQTTILNEIADHDIDVLVMGGYGTPSLKQKIFGGVTRSILSSMIIPVFMSH